MHFGVGKIDKLENNTANKRGQNNFFMHQNSIKGSGGISQKNSNIESKVASSGKDK